MKPDERIDAGCDVEISFVLPCLNEALTIEACIKECRQAIRDAGVQGEVVVADNGSTDGSQTIAARAGARVVHVSQPGYGSALMGGIRAARGKYVIMGDGDLSYDFTQMPGFLEKLRQGEELVMGCRLPRGGGCIQPGAMPFLHRWLGNPVLSGIGRLLFGVGITDFHCGIRAFDRQRLLDLDLRTPGMEFASEMVVKARLAGLRISEVPVTLRPDGRNRPPHLKTWRDGWRHLRFMLLHAPRWLVLYPGIVITLLALACFILLLMGPVQIGRARFDTNTLLVAHVGVLAGVQVILLGLFSEVFSRRLGLLPSSRAVERLLESGPFEKGIFIGGSLFLSGLACLTVAFFKWHAVGFGDLTYPDTLRLVIPGATGMALGLQVVFGGFVLAALGFNSTANGRQ
jgi:glycosyltransferase involved in cell wall biosynthesis